MNKTAVRTVSTILVLMLVAILPASANDNGNAVQLVQAFYQQIRTASEASDVARIAEQTGPVVDTARRTLRLEELETLRDLLEAMQARTRQVLAESERVTGQGEAALERLYRSQAWDELGLAETSFIYWTAWIDLEIARQTRSGRDKILARARKGFQTASLQFFRPGLLYGGWLGIGIVDMEQGHPARARQIFTKLDEALSAIPDSQVIKAISLELRLQEIRLGDAEAAGAVKIIDPTQDQMLRREVFTLLEQSRREGRNFEGMAQRLRILIQAGRMDQRLLENMMAYSQEIAALDVNPWNSLAAAEYRLAHKDYPKALRKYEAFFKEYIPQQGINLDRFRYHQALAAYKSGSYQAALSNLDKLARRDELATEIDKAVAKLLYTVHLARAFSGDTKPDLKSLHSAAQQFVAKNPDDAEADQARMVLAQTSPDTGNALKALRRIRTTTRFGGAVERTAFDLIAREFSTRISSARTEAAIDLAYQGINAFRELPQADRKKQFNTAMALQMRALAEPDPAELISSLEFLDNLKDYEREKQEELVAAHPDEMTRSLGFHLIEGARDANIDYALSWSRLQLYDRLGDWSGLTGMLRRLDEGNSPGLPPDFIFPWIAGREDTLQRLELAQIAHPSAAALPDIDRRFYRLIIESLLSINRQQAAHEKALAFTREHPNSGDAWRLLARTAALAGDPFTADKAWSVITDKVLPTSDIWWEGMLGRVRIRSASPRPEQACPLLQELQRRIRYIPDSQKAAYETILESSPCRRISAAIHRQGPGHERREL